MQGDPEGRRLARWRAARLSEAGMLLRAVEVLLRSADFVPADCRDLAVRIAREEQAQLQKAEGRIESRRRFKYGTSHPLLDERAANLLFIDESGHSAPQSTLDQPVFALGAVAMSENEATRYVKRSDEIKQRFFDPADFTFHEPAMRRHEQMYHFGGDVDRQKDFGHAIKELIGDTDFTAFGTAIRKQAFKQEFSESGIDPYLPANPYAVAITLLLERYVDYLLSTSGQRRLGKVTFESQGPKEDAEHQVQFARLLLDGTQWVPDSAFRQAIQPGASFVPKVGSHPLELADIFVRDLYEWARADCHDSPLHWDLFTNKMYCRGDAKNGKFGVKIFPDSDIRDRIERHRAQRVNGDDPSVN